MPITSMRASRSLASVSHLAIHVAWKHEDGRKPPFSVRTHQKCDTADLSHLGSLAKAKRAAEAIGGGVGLVLMPLPDDPELAIGMIDLDGCRDPETGKLEEHVQPIIDRFGYSEVSPSQGGVKSFPLYRVADLPKIQKLIGKGKLSISWKRGDHEGIELYFGKRYGTLTEHAIDDHYIFTGKSELRIVDVADLRWLIEVAGPRYRDGSPQGVTVAPSNRDESGSGAGLHFILGRIWAGDDVETALAALMADEGEAGEWAARARPGEVERTARRAHKHVAAQQARTLAMLDDEYTEEAGEPKIAGGFDLDEDGIIQDFTARYRNELRFDHTSGKWHHFDGTYWRPEETKLAHHYARTVSTELAKGDKKAKALKNVRTWEAVERGARPVRDFAATWETWNRDPLLLGTPGGTVGLRTGELRPARPEDYISRITAVAPIPLERFDPDRDCPVWLGFMHHALREDAEAIRFFRQWGGYSLTGLTHLQALVFVYGPGGSGKGTAVNTLGDILKDYAANVGMETLTASKHERHTTELARLNGIRMARASETEKGKAWAENRIKNLTGEDTITARFMRRDDFEFKPQFKLTIFGNSRPSLKDVDHAIRRRFLILPFDNPPAVRDGALGSKLRQEWPGILSWFIQGWLDLQQNGLIRPAVVAAATEEYFAQNDIFGQWLDACCEQAPAFRDTSKRLWDSWSTFAHAEGHDPGTKQGSFPETMKQRGFETGKAEQSRGYIGVRLLPKLSEPEHALSEADVLPQGGGDEIPADVAHLI